MEAPKAPAGWYPDTEVADQLRYWDGDAWTTHTAPTSAPPPPNAVTAAHDYFCPYCKGGMAVDATRCGSCGGELKYCKRCNDLVGVWTKEKFVGLARGGIKTQYRCMACNYVIDGPRF